MTGSTSSILLVADTHRNRRMLAEFGELDPPALPARDATGAGRTEGGSIAERSGVVIR